MQGIFAERNSQDKEQERVWDSEVHGLSDIHQSWPATGKIPETGTERTGIFRFRSGIDESSDRSIPFRCQVLTVPFSVPV